MNKLFLFLIFFFGFLNCIFSQSLTSTNTTHNSTLISFPNSEGENLNIHVFTKSSEDTIVLFENFSRFPITNSGNLYSANSAYFNLPSSYTNKPGFKGRNLFNTNGDSCSFYENSGLVTPFMDLSKSGGNYRLRFSIKNTNTSNVNFLRIYQSDSLGNFPSTYSVVTVAKNSSKIYDTIFSNGNSNCKLWFFSSTSPNLIIDDLSVSYTYITKTPIPYSPFTTNLNSLQISSLNPNTIYHCFIEGRTDTISFTTLNQSTINNVSDISPNSAKLNFSSTDTNSNRKVILKKKSNGANVFADDLFISEYTTATTDDRAIEIYNGTGQDICLGDYSIKYNLATGAVRISPLSYLDTIKSNQCFVVMELLKSINVSNEGAFCKDTILKGYFVYNGDDAIALMKNGEYVDIFGCLGEDPGIKGWCYPNQDNPTITTNKTTLRRKSNVNKGVKVNPTSGFPTLNSQWTQIGSVGNTNANNFADFGKHTMSNAYGNVDSLAKMENISNTDTSFILANLEEDTYYEATLLFINGNDSVYSNSILFQTGVNSQRLTNGSWNDANWSKRKPTKIDNAIILNNQTLRIDNGTNAECYNLIIKDTLNQKKASFINNGNLNVWNKTIVESYFKGYTANDNGWNLYGLPIKTTSSTQDSIGNVFFNISANDDLYYWKEDYGNEGIWMNWQDASNIGDFFVDGRGYLVSYENDKLLKFYGELNNESSYSLLSNASLSTPNTQRGWHLCSNPYPFYVKLNQLQRTNVSLPSLLDNNTSNYFALLPTDSIPPFAGFMVQVGNLNNSLTINRTASESKNIEDFSVINLNVSYSDGNDKTYIIITDSASLGYDINYDNRKLSGWSQSPEIFTKYGNEKFPLNSIPKIEDSLIVDIGFVAKTEDNYNISLDFDSIDQYYKISLFDKATNVELINFKNDSVYSFYSNQINSQDKFQLKIYRNQLSDEEIKTYDENISLYQSEDKVNVISSSKILSLELTNLKGQKINNNVNSNSINIDQKGIFILNITTQNKTYIRKIINL